MQLVVPADGEDLFRAVGVVVDAGLEVVGFWVGDADVAEEGVVDVLVPLLVY